MEPRRVSKAPPGAPRVMVPHEGEAAANPAEFVEMGLTGGTAEASP